MDKIREKVRKDRRLTVQEIATDVGMSIGSVHFILTDDLRVQRESVKFVPMLLTEEQMKLGKEISEDMLGLSFHDLVFLKTIITGDETWVHDCDSETKF